MHHKGTIGIPNPTGSYVVVRWEVETYKIRYKTGLNGGKIKWMKATVEGEPIVLYNQEWIVEPKDQIGWVVTQILTQQYNGL